MNEPSSTSPSGKKALEESNQEILVRYLKTVLKIKLLWIQHEILCLNSQCKYQSLVKD